MILLHQFKEGIAALEPVNAGTATFTRTRSEANDQDPLALSKTQTITAVHAETIDSDESRTHGRIFPRPNDPNSDK